MPRSRPQAKQNTACESVLKALMLLSFLYKKIKNCYLRIVFLGKDPTAHLELKPGRCSEVVKMIVLCSFPGFWKPQSTNDYYKCYHNENDLLNESRKQRKLLNTHNL